MASPSWSFEMKAEKIFRKTPKTPVDFDADGTSIITG
jgi:hypothetical protein